MEIVSKPDMRSAEEAKAYVTKLRTILRYLGTCDGNMEQGSLRADVNVSVRRPGEGLGTRCEIKNVNSIRFIGQAIDVEARRQIGILEDGGAIDQETRLFDPDKGETRSMRSKEEAHDYRYFPDPDLLPLEFDQAYVDALAGICRNCRMPRRARFIAEYGLPPYDAGVLVADKETADYFEAAVAHGGTERDAKAVANWIMGDVSAYAQFGRPDRPADASEAGADRRHCRSHRRRHDLRQDRQGSAAILIEEERRRSARHRRGARNEAGDRSGAIETAVDAIIAANPDKVAQAQAKPSMLGWFVGQVMKQNRRQGQSASRQ